MPTNLWNQIGLRDNPFNSLNSARESDLARYFVPVVGVNDETILNSQDSCLVTGSRGYGKTALRRMVAFRCSPHNADSQILCLEYTPDEFHNDLGSIQDSTMYGNLHGRIIAKMAERIVDQFQNGTSHLSAATQGLDGLTVLRRTAQKLREFGVERCLCLVDGIDEYQNPALTGDLLVPLLEYSSFLTETQFIFHFFLPPDLLKKTEIKNNPKIRWDRIRRYSLTWGPKELRELIVQRLSSYSLNTESQVQGLGQLCTSEPESDLAPLSRRIDQELIDFIYHVPQKTRALIDVARMLLERHIQHIQQINNANPITQAEWQAVQEIWIRERGKDFGLESEDVLPFTNLDGQLYYQGNKISFSNRINYLLLKCLVSANGVMVQHGDLIRGAWPEAIDISAVTNDAVKQAVMRLRSSLKEQGINPEHIQSVRGLGYRIVP